MGMIFKFDENDERQDDWLSSGVDENLKPKASISPQERYKNQLAIKSAIESTYNKKVNKKVNSKPNNMNTSNNVIGLVLAIVLAIVTWVLSPEFVAENFGIQEESFGTIRLVATLLSVAIGAYNGYQIQQKSK